MNRTSLTIADLPFIEQIADDIHPLAALLKQCGGHDDASRHRWALAHIARHTTDEATIRAIMAEADTESSGIPEDNDIMTAIARNPATPLDMMTRLAWNRYLIVCELGAICPALPEDELRRLAVSGHLGARCGVAVNPSAPDDVRRALADDPHEWVRLRVAAWYRENPS